MNKKTMNKKGISNIISVVLVVLLVITSIAIVWGIVSKFTSNSSDPVELALNPVNLNFFSPVLVSPAIGNQKNIDIVVRRDFGGGDVTGLVIILTKDDNTILSIEPVNSGLTPGEVKTIHFLYDLGTNTVVKVEIIPKVKTTTGKEARGKAIVSSHILTT